MTRTDNPVWYASRSAGAEHEMKKALKRGDDGTLNVYTTSGGAYLGWAYLPEITDTAQAYLDGIVIDWRTAPHVSDEYENEFDEGDTLTHEAGHWLISSTRSTASATSRATSSTTRRRRSRRARAARKTTTPARRQPGLDSDPQLHGLLRR